MTGSYEVVAANVDSCNGRWLYKEVPGADFRRLAVEKLAIERLPVESLSVERLSKKRLSRREVASA